MNPGYKLQECDLARPLERLVLADHEHGLGLIVRRGPQPLGFLLRAFEPGSEVEVSTLQEWIAQELGQRILSQTITRELQPPPPTQPRPSLTAAICTRHRPAVLRRCLESLLPFRELEILVIDNSPPDSSTCDLASQFPGVRYSVEPRPGLDFARNRAWRESSTDWVAYLDDDVVVDSNWLAAFHAVLQTYPDAGAVTGLVLPWTLDTEAEVLFEKYGGFRRGFDRRRYRAHLPGNRLFPAGAGVLGSGCNMAFRRDVLAALGGFDEALDTGRPLPGGGDLDIFFRTLEAGHPLIYDPAFLIRHEHRKDLVALRHQYYTWGLGLMAYVGKHLRPGGSSRPQFRGLVRWWFRAQLRQVKECLRGRHPLPLPMILAELWGGCVGLAWEYERSCARSARIRKEHP